MSGWQVATVVLFVAVLVVLEVAFRAVTRTTVTLASTHDLKRGDRLDVGVCRYRVVRVIDRTSVRVRRVGGSNEGNTQ